jgi:hypothetical protein
MYNTLGEVGHQYLVDSNMVYVIILKGIVQRKLRWVKNGVNPWYRSQTVVLDITWSFYFALIFL